jgi:hypothetical protein
MRFRPANIRLINRRPKNAPTAAGPVLEKSNRNDKNNPTDSQGWTGSLHIRDFASNVNLVRGTRIKQPLLDIQQRCA